MNIKRIINQYRTSNTYIIYNVQAGVCVIDPGGPDSHELISWLKENEKIVIAIFLTHEHPDHCMGVNELISLYDAPVFCSQICSKNITSSKLNYSLYSHDIVAFEITNNIRELEDREVICLNGYQFEILKTPGHSPGSACILLDKVHFFTGDSLFKEMSVPLNLPHSSKENYENSLEIIKKELVNTEIIIHPGHGASFEVSDVSL